MFEKEIVKFMRAVAMVLELIKKEESLFSESLIHLGIEIL